jgi:plasmid stabilization system protein ParE
MSATVSSTFSRRFPPAFAVTRFTVSVLPEAEADIREAFLWYRERSLLAAEGFRSEVFEAIDDRAETGGVWPRDEDGVHRRVLKSLAKFASRTP